MEQKLGNFEQKQAGILKSLKDTSLTLEIALMNKKFTIQDLVNLSPGSVLMFDTHHAIEAKVSVNEKVVATGAVIQVGENFGLQVKQIVADD